MFYFFSLVQVDTSSLFPAIILSMTLVGFSVLYCHKCHNLQDFTILIQCYSRTTILLSATPFKLLGSLNTP